MYYFQAYRLATYYFGIIITINEALAKTVFKYNEPKMCKDKTYFDVASFSCKECNATRYLESSANRLNCICNKFSKVIGFQDGNPVCSYCGDNATATSDGKNCISCRDERCSCPNNQQKIERSLSGNLLSTMQCLPCPEDTYLSDNGFECLSCNSSKDIDHDNNDCSCPLSSHIRIRTICLPKEELPNWPHRKEIYSVPFKSGIIDSFYFHLELLNAAYLCKKNDKTSCEHLSNLCILTLGANEMACTWYYESYASSFNFLYTKDRMEMLNSEQISKRYSLNKLSNNSTLNLTFATFSLRGDLLAIGKPKLPCHILSSVRFGVNIKKNCKMFVNDLLDSKVEFLLPFLAFENNDIMYLHKLPVLLVDSEMGEEISRQPLVSKMFLIDNISGYKAVTNFVYGGFKKDSKLSVLRYMKSLQVLVNVKNGENYGQIYPPLLKIKYGELTYDEIFMTEEVSLDYEIKFVLKTSNVNIYIQVIVGILSGVGLIWSVLKTWCYSSHDLNSLFDTSHFLWFFIYSMGTIGSILIIVTYSFCMYLFIFYKGQTIPQVLLPDDATENTIWICTIVAFCFKVVEMTGFFYRLWNIDIFFIDWEQPRTIQYPIKYDSPRTSLNKSYRKILNEHEDSTLNSPASDTSVIREYNSEKTKRRMKMKNEQTMKMTSTIKLSSQGENVDNNLPVSVWRTYLVANEWLKLQAVRRINTILQFVFSLFILEVIGIKHWSLAIPELQIDDTNLGIERNFILEYGLCGLVYIMVYLTQWLFTAVIYERYIQNQIQGFTDLCPVTNVSVFILLCNNYGFYIHGRSVHGFTDTDLPTLINNLQLEEQDLCAHRGLVPGTTDQTFIVMVTKTFRNSYNAMASVRTDHKNNRLYKKDSREYIDHIVNKHIKVKQFLSQYLDHCFKDEDYIIKEQRFFEKLCNIPLFSIRDKSVFYIDNNHSFDQIILYGNEWLLLTFELVVFAVILSTFKNYILALITTVTVSHFLIHFIKYNSKKILCKKSMLDERFLL